MKTGQVIVEQLQQALNSHNLEAFVDCFAPDYQSDQPIHPERAFQGAEQVRKNWTKMFQDGDIHAELLRFAIDGDTVWAEWHWFGTNHDGGQFNMRGVTIMGVQADRIIWGRLYMEPVQEPSAV
jgi:ketosteroid isomerase-like protein